MAESREARIANLFLKARTEPDFETMSRYLIQVCGLMVREAITRSAEERKVLKEGGQPDMFKAQLPVTYEGPVDRWRATRDAGLMVMAATGLVSTVVDNPEHTAYLKGRARDVATAHEMLTIFWGKVPRETRAWRKDNIDYRAAYLKGLEQRNWQDYHRILNQHILTLGENVAYEMTVERDKVVEAMAKQGGPRALADLKAEREPLAEATPE